MVAAGCRRLAAIGAAGLTASCANTGAEVPSAPAPEPPRPSVAGVADVNANVPCSLGSASFDRQCPTAVLFGDGGQADLYVIGLFGDQRILSYTGGGFVSDAGPVQATPAEGGWHVRVDGNEHFLVRSDLLGAG